MTHDEKSVDRLLKSLPPPAFRNDAHQALLRERLAAEAQGAEQTETHEGLKMILIHKSRSRLWRWSVATALGLLVIGLFWGLSGGNGNRAYAAVIQKLREAKIVSCVAHVREQNGQESSVELAFYTPNIIRKDMHEGKIAIVDVAAGKGIVLFEKEKQYVEIGVNVGLTTETMASGDFIKQLRELQVDMSMKIGLKQIGGVNAEGYRQIQSGIAVELWLDPKTETVLRIDYIPQEHPEMGLYLTDFQFDPPMEEVQFSLTPPAGYTALAVPNRQAKPSEEDLVYLLRFFAEYSKEKAYPETLDPISMAPQMMTVAKYSSATLSAMPMDKRLELGIHLQNGTLFVTGLMSSGAEWQYAGKGLSPKDGSQPVCWWRPKGSDKFRVITADLQIVEMEEKDFPRLVDYEDEYLEIVDSMATGSSWSPNNDLAARGMSLKDLIEKAYGYGKSGYWIDCGGVPNLDARYDIKVKKRPEGDVTEIYSAVRRALEAHFGLTTRTETRLMDAYVLTAPQGRPPQLRDPKNTNASYYSGYTPIEFVNSGLGGLVEHLRYMLKAPVVDETGLTGQYDYEFKRGFFNTPSALAAAVHDQLGLVLTPAKRELQYLIITKRE